MALTTTIQDYLRLSLTRCKDLGYFVPNATAEGVITWTSAGERIAAVRFKTDTVNNRCTISYRTDGEDVTQKVWLRWCCSNLNRGGYYYFVCPVTGRSCRNLYLVNGRFVSRFAFKALYETQAESHSQRGNPLFKTLDAWDKLEKLERQKYRRYTYRGKPTPYARRVERLFRKAERLAGQTDRYIERHT